MTPPFTASIRGTMRSGALGWRLLLLLLQVTPKAAGERLRGSGRGAARWVGRPGVGWGLGWAGGCPASSPCRRAALQCEGLRARLAGVRVQRCLLRHGGAGGAAERRQLREIREHQSREAAAAQRGELPAQRPELRYRCWGHRGPVGAGKDRLVQPGTRPTVPKDPQSILTQIHPTVPKDPQSIPTHPTVPKDPQSQPIPLCPKIPIPNRPTVPKDPNPNPSHRA